MKLLIRLFAATLLVAGSLAAQEQFVGKWAGSTETVDDVNVHRYERHTIELKMENGKLVAGQVGRNGSSSPMEVQVDGNKVNLYRFLPTDGGEPLRWKLELKDGKLVGCTSARTIIQPSGSTIAVARSPWRRKTQQPQPRSRLPSISTV